MRTDQTFDMLHDMIPDRVEANILIPYLQGLFDKCDAEDGYWTFLQEIHPHISYYNGHADNYPNNDSKSFLFDYILRLLKPKFTLAEDSIPAESDFLVDEFGYIYDCDECPMLVNLATASREYLWLKELPETAGWTYEFDVKDIRDSLFYGDIRKALNNDDFILKSEYNTARAYLEEMKSRQQGDDDFFEGLL
jgi:hypothetical protein